MGEKRFELIEDKNGYNRISCPLCNSCLYYSRQITYPNGEQYFEFDCSVCNFTGRIRMGNIYD